MNSQAKKVALGGVFAALALVIMCLVGLIPIATYVCPMFCAIICNIVLCYGGQRIAWAWYTSVAILSLLLAPDKEAAFIFVFLGYYPIIRPFFKKPILGILLKIFYFNLSVFIVYTLLIYLMGLDYLWTEFTEFGWIGLSILLLLGNVCFFMLDFLLGRMRHFGKR